MKIVKRGANALFRKSLQGIKDGKDNENINHALWRTARGSTGGLSLGCPPFRIGKCHIIFDSIECRCRFRIFSKYNTRRKTAMRAAALIRIIVTVELLFSMNLKSGVKSLRAILKHGETREAEGTLDNNSQSTTFPHPITRVAVIGAGPSALQAAAYLLAISPSADTNALHPLGVTGFTLGRRSLSTIHNPVNAISDEYPTTREGEDDLSLEERWKEYWQSHPVWYNLHTNGPALWSVFVQHDVQRQVTFYSTRVETIKKCNETATWTLTLRQLPESKRLEAETIATQRGIPERPCQFAHPDHLALLLSVMLVGASVSAIKLARSIAPFTHRLFASVRFDSAQQPNKYRDMYGLNILFGFPGKVEIVPEIACFGLLSENAIGIKNGEITLVKGTVLPGIDEYSADLGRLHPQSARPSTKPLAELPNFVSSSSTAGVSQRYPVAAGDHPATSQEEDIPSLMDNDTIAMWAGAPTNLGVIFLDGNDFLWIPDRPAFSGVSRLDFEVSALNLPFAARSVSEYWTLRLEFFEMFTPGAITR
ncbi:hypothetical protein B0H16DRAFT_1448060 [Mycena metata]|uniref:FAD/NAD(P)-binding domain-containing protein n=1 Tax=Mycena metata TaxID=1033252 RepID=A0AAD7NXR1_9AGAR|nr:hypothetical protein B0H16DRAFT_1448060 [Mycena metata]